MREYNFRRQEWMSSLVRCKVSFIRFAAALLFITAAAKLQSVLHPVPLLFVPDSVFPVLTMQQVLTAACVLQLAIVLFILISPDSKLKLAAIAWLSCLFLTYRLGLLLVHHPNYRPCLGTPGQDLGLSPHFVSTFMLATSVSLFSGSCIGLALERFWGPKIQ